jgi:hypothetical protein
MKFVLFHPFLHSQIRSRILPFHLQDSIITYIPASDGLPNRNYTKIKGRFEQQVAYYKESHYEILV